MIIPQVVSADSFIDTIGVNIHLHYTDTVYNRFEDIIEPRLVELGVRHVRDGAMTYSGISGDSFYYQRIRQLANQGIQFNLITQALDTSWGEPTDYSLLDEVYEWSGQSVVSFEGVNEPDIQGVESWLPDTLLGQENLYTTVNGDPDLQSVAVLGPSIVQTESYPLVGDLSDQMDFGNIHNYLSGRHPETSGWGDDGYGSLDWHLAQVSTVSGSDPIMSTETGWHNAQDAEGNIVGVPLAVEAKYVPRLFLTHFNSGIVRTYLYELIDVYNQPTVQDSNFGLLNNDGSPQPAYLALKNLINRLEDPGPDFTPVPLTLSITGQTDQVYSTVMQKRDGTYFVALWLGRASWNPDTNSSIQVPPQTVNISLPQNFTLATLHQFQPDGTVEETTGTFADGQFSLSVTDAVTLVELPAPTAHVPQVSAALMGNRLSHILSNLGPGPLFQAQARHPCPLTTNGEYLACFDPGLI